MSNPLIVGQMLLGAMTSTALFGPRFSWSAERVIAISSVANVVLALVLAGITCYYARNAKRQADASVCQVAASNRQADAAQKTLELLTEQKAQQHRIDISIVDIQIASALKAIDEWQKRVSADSGELPEGMEIAPVGFAGAFASAERIDSSVAQYMMAGQHYIREAEVEILGLRQKVLRPSDGYIEATRVHNERQTLRAKAGKALNVARFKLDQARSRFEAIRKITV